MTDETTRLPSTTATGGAGTIHEYRFAATVFVALLAGDRIPGLNAPVSGVGLQRRYAGHLLDDVVARGVIGPGDEQTIEFQVKRTLSPTAGDEDFLTTVSRAVEVIRADPDAVAADRRRLGIAARGSAQLEELRTLSDTARAHADAGSFAAVVESTHGRPVRERLKHFRDAVSAAMPDATEPEVDETTLLCAKTLFVWQTDVGFAGSDTVRAINRLAELVPAGHAAVDGVFAQIAELAEEWGPRGATVDAPMLRSALELRGVALNGARSQRAALARLSDTTTPLLDPATAQLHGSLHLPRASLRDQVLATLRQHRVVLLTGKAGAGKSVLARVVARHLQEEGGATVVAISLAGNTGGFAALEAELGVQLVDALSAAPTGALRLLLIDGSEQALRDAGGTLAAVLRAVPVDSESAPPWRVLLTARDEAALTVASIAKDTLGVAPETLPVGDLTDDEVEEVLEFFPSLRALDRHERPRSLILRRLYLIELLLRACEGTELPDGILGEEDVVDYVFEHLVRRGEGARLGIGSPDARADVFLAMAQSVLNNAVPARLEGADDEARRGLVSDDVLRRERTTYVFAHDILIDYAVATLLLAPGEIQHIHDVFAPRRLLRGVRLWIQRQLADAVASGTLLERWPQIIALLADLSDIDGPRWNDLGFEALLNIGVCRSALEELTPWLLSDDGAQLLRLIDVTERLGRQRTVTIDAPVVPIDPSLSAPVVDLLAELRERVPESLTWRAQLLARAHLTVAAKDRGSAVYGLEHPGLLPKSIVQWTGDDEYGRRLETAAEALACLGDFVTVAEERFLIEHMRQRPDDVAGAIEATTAVTELAKSRPELCLRLASLYYLGEEFTLTGVEEGRGSRPRSPRGWDPDLLDEGGVREHSPQHNDNVYVLASPSMGAFSALLDASPPHGLRLIGAVVERATKVRMATEGLELSLDVQLPDWDQPRRFSGTGHVYQWYRRTSVGPFPAMSAVIALREWAVRQAQAGVPLSELVRQILEGGTSFGLIAVALSLLVDRLEDVRDELDPFLEHPLLWHLKNGRAVAESHGGLAYPFPEPNRVKWTFSDVALRLVLSADAARRDQFRRIGEKLVAQQAELGDDRDREALSRRWASELDSNLLRTEKYEDGLLIGVTYPDEVVEQLAVTGRQAELSLRRFALFHRAARVRDGEEDGDAREVWKEMKALMAVIDAEGDPWITPLEREDALAAAAAALILAAAKSVSVNDNDLSEATTVLQVVTEGVAVGSPRTVHEDVLGASRDTIWPDGADRSAAMALPMLLASSDLAARCRATPETLEGSVLTLAASPFAETRGRLVSSLISVTRPDDACAVAHEVIVGALRRLVASAGLGPRVEGRRDRIVLDEPLEPQLATDALVLDVRAAADALPGLVAASRLPCAHGESALALLEALVDHDLRMWPARMARHNYRDAGWRAMLDDLAAERILDGDEAHLATYLDAFEAVGEHLRGLLAALASKARGEDRAKRLIDVWSSILDRLLSPDRALSDGERRPYPREVNDLDELLLPYPADETWDSERFAVLLWRWVKAFEGKPRAVDRLLTVLGRIGWLTGDVSAEAILIVAGTDTRAIARDSRLFVAWLRTVLHDEPEAAGRHSVAARTLLDRLAADGHEGALRLQQLLEA